MVVSNKEMVENMINDGILINPIIIEAFMEIDRIDFVREEFIDEAYANYPLPIGYGQTISQPTTVGIMLELLNPKKGDFILDIGSGSGWTTTLLGKIVNSKGKVIGTELIFELVEQGINNLKKYNLDNVTIIKAPNNELGIKGKQFDKILVSAAADKLPQELVDQLKIGGSMVIPIKNSLFLLKKIEEEKIDIKEYFGFSFVPLIHKEILKKKE